MRLLCVGALSLAHKHENSSCCADLFHGARVDARELVSAEVDLLNAVEWQLHVPLAGRFIALKPCARPALRRWCECLVSVGLGSVRVSGFGEEILGSCVVHLAGLLDPESVKAPEAASRGCLAALLDAVEWARARRLASLERYAWPEVGGVARVLANLCASAPSAARVQACAQMLRGEVDVAALTVALGRL